MAQEISDTVYPAKESLDNYTFKIRELNAHHYVRVCFNKTMSKSSHCFGSSSFLVPGQVRTGRPSDPLNQTTGLGPFLRDIEMAELVYSKSMRRELGSAGRLDGLEGLCPARRGVAVLLLLGQVWHAQPVVVFCFDLQATDHVLLRLRRHEARPPMLPDQLPAGNAVAQEERGQEHDANKAP